MLSIFRVQHESRRPAGVRNYFRTGKRYFNQFFSLRSKIVLVLVKVSKSDHRYSTFNTNKVCTYLLPYNKYLVNETVFSNMRLPENV